MDLKGTGVEIDPNGKISAEDRAEEFDAKLREFRGEFQGYYTGQFEAKNKAMRDINDSRGVSGVGQNMMEDIHAYRDKKSRLGGPKKSEITGPDPEDASSAFPLWKDRIVPESHGFENDPKFYRNSPWLPVEPDPNARGIELPGIRRGETVIIDEGGNRWTPEQAEMEYGYRDGIAGIMRQDRQDVPTNRMEDSLETYNNKQEYITSQPTVGELWKALGSFIKAPEREMNPATLAAWGTWNLANMAVEGGEKMVQAFKNFDELLYGVGYQAGTGDEAGARAGASVATAVASGGLAMPAPAGAITMFAGRRTAETLAKTGGSTGKLPLQAMEKAEEMALAGATDKEIRAATNEILKDSPFGGIHLGDDGRWRIEFSDRLSRTNASFDYNLEKVMQPGEKVTYKLSDMFDQPFANSLGLKDNVSVTVTKANPKLKNFQPSGRHVAKADGTHDITINAQNREQVRDVLLHELQHAIQRREGFEYGGSAAQDNSYINPVQQKVFHQRLEASEDYNFAKIQNEKIWEQASKDAAERGVTPAFKARSWQTLEDMQGGYSFEQFSPHWQGKIAEAEKQVKDSFEALQKEFPWTKSDRYLAYERLSGEVEARNVQTRKDWLPAERRDTLPVLTEDVPRDLRHQWSDFGDPRGQLTSEMANTGRYTEARKLDNQITQAERRLDRLLGKIKEGGERESRTQVMRQSAIREQERLQRYRERREAMDIGLTPPNDRRLDRRLNLHMNEFREPAVPNISQGVPKSLQEVEARPTGSLMIKRLEDRLETLMAVLKNDSSNKKALAEFNKIQQKLSTVKQKN